MKTLLHNKIEKDKSLFSKYIILINMNEKFRKNCEHYVSFFKKGTVSSSDPDSVIENPFFISEAKDGNYINTNITSNISNEYKETFSKLGLSTRILYSFIGENKEFFINDFTFLTLQQIHKRINNYDYFYDIALKYAGMGHVIVLAYHPKTNKYFLRHDGGANGYERENYYNFYKNYNPANDNSIKGIFFDFEINKLITFNEFIKILEIN